MKHFVTSLFILLSAGAVWGQETRARGEGTGDQPAAQARQISGVIVDQDGNPLQGAAVRVYAANASNALSGTITNARGEFSLTVNSTAALRLEVSYLGFKTLSQSVAANSTGLSITMQDKETTLDQVVITGYGSQIKREFTGASGSVGAAQLENVPVSTLENALQGRLAGVQITQGSGKLGGGIAVRVRGPASVNASNQPLYVVDGIPITTEDLDNLGGEPTSPIADLNFNDIENIEVLKDAAAAALYGARGSNGVVLITTKRGRAGKTRVNLGAYTGWMWESVRRDFNNAAGYINGLNEGSLNAGFGVPFWDLSAPDGTASGLIGIPDGTPFYFDLFGGFPLPYFEGVDTDWQDEIYKVGRQHQVDFSINGGDDRTTYLISALYNDADNFLIENRFQRASARLVLDHKVSQFFKIGASINVIRTQNDRVIDDNAFSTFGQAVALAPNMPVRDPFTGDFATDIFYYNPLIETEESILTTEVLRNISSIYGEFSFLKNFTYRMDWALDLLNQEERRYNGVESLDGANAGGPGLNGEAIQTNSNVTNWIMKHLVTYKPALGENHNLNLAAGFEYNWSQTEVNLSQSAGFPNNNLPFVGAGAVDIAAASDRQRFTFVSWVFRGNYIFNKKYQLGVSGRVDASSRFGEDNRYGFFPGVSAGWVLSEESFLQTEAISFLRLRASYGLTGNAEIGNFESQTFSSPIRVKDVAGIGSPDPGSSDLRWETTATANLAVDYGFFNDRLTGSVDVFQRTTTDLLLLVQIPPNTGIGDQFINAGEMENTGVELQVNANILTGAFKWTTNANFTYVKNEVTDVDGNVITAGFDAFNVAQEGLPLASFVGPEYAGVDDTNGDALYFTGLPDDETTGVNESVTNNPNAADRRRLGNAYPTTYGGFSNNFSYKGFDFSFLIQWQAGNEVYNAAAKFQTAAYDFLDNQTEGVTQDAWRAPGQGATAPQLRLFSGNGTAPSSYAVYDASFVRLKQVSFGYTLPATFVQQFKLSTVRFYCNATNLGFLYNKYPNGDPEVSSNSTANISQGQDFYTIPQARTMVVGVNIGI